MSNIGHVQYFKSDDSGKLNAIWVHAEDGHGKGVAIGNPSGKFDGKYQVKYFDKNDILVAELDLEIINNGHNYELTWSKDGVVTSIGIGMENSNVLSAGYYDVMWFMKLSDHP